MFHNGRLIMLFVVSIVSTFMMYYIVQLVFKKVIKMQREVILTKRYKILLFIVIATVIYIILHVYFTDNTNDNAAFCVGYGNIVFVRYISPIVGICMFFAMFFIIILGIHTKKLSDASCTSQKYKTSVALKCFNKIISVILLSLVLLSLTIPLIIGTIIYNKQLCEYNDIIKQNKCNMIEGKVHVVSYGSTYKGCPKSDKILIGNRAFEITPNWSPAYNVPVVSGGILNNGVNVKIYYYQNDILKIYVLNHDCYSSKKGRHSSHISTPSNRK